MPIERVESAYVPKTEERVGRENQAHEMCDGTGLVPYLTQSLHSLTALFIRPLGGCFTLIFFQLVQWNLPGKSVTQ